MSVFLCDLTLHRCLSRLVPYLSSADVSGTSLLVINEILEIFQEVGLGRLETPALDMTKIGIFKPSLDLLGAVSVQCVGNELLISLLRLFAAIVTVDSYARECGPKWFVILTWRCVDMEIWRCVDMEIWRYGDKKMYRCIDI